MPNTAKNKTKMPLICVSVMLLVLTMSSRADKDVHKVIKKVAGMLIDKLPNPPKHVSYMKLSRRHIRIALALHLAPKVIYWQLTKKYKNEHKKNEKMRKKYRTIIPVSALPYIGWITAFNREKNSEYYVVGADDYASALAMQRKPGFKPPDIAEETKAAYDKASMLGYASQAKHETMFINAMMAHQSVLDHASMAEGGAISQAEHKNQQAILDVENEVNNIKMSNKVNHISYEHSNSI